MYRAAIVSKPQKPEVASLLPELLVWLHAHQYEALLDVDSAAYLGQKGIERTELPAHRPGLVIVLGGDGTLLHAARAFAQTKTPILSVNLGSLGFLTEIPLSDLYGTLENWCNGVADIDLRTMMHARCCGADRCCGVGRAERRGGREGDHCADGGLHGAD